MRGGRGRSSPLRAAAAARPLAPLLASLCLVGTGNSLLTTAVSLDLGGPGTDEALVPFVLTAYPAGFLAGCLVARGIVAHLGHRGAFLLASGLAAAAGYGYARTGLLPVWSALRFANGASIAAIFVVVESWMNLYAGDRVRGVVFSLYMTTTSLSVLGGQLVVEAAGPRSPSLFATAAVTMTCGILLCLVAGRWPVLPAWSGEARGPVTRVGSGLTGLAAAVPATLAAVFLAGMTNTNLYSMMPIYGLRVGLSAEDTVSLATAFSLGGLAAQGPVGWLSDHADRRSVLLVQGALVVACCGAVLATGSGPLPLLLATFFVYGAVALTIYPVGVSFANARLDGHQMVAAAGALLLVYSLGNVLTPGAAGTLMSHVAPQALFVLLGSGGALLALVAAFDLLRRPRPALAALRPQSPVDRIDR
jgi:MFS family permease